MGKDVQQQGGVKTVVGGNQLMWSCYWKPWKTSWIKLKKQVIFRSTKSLSEWIRVPREALWQITFDHLFSTSSQNRHSWENDQRVIIEVKCCFTYREKHQWCFYSHLFVSLVFSYLLMSCLLFWQITDLTKKCRDAECCSFCRTPLTYWEGSLWSELD